LTGHRTAECWKTMWDKPTLNWAPCYISSWTACTGLLCFCIQTTSLPYTRHAVVDKGQRRTLDSSRTYNTQVDRTTHDVFYRGLCDIIRLVPFLATSHYNTNRSDETSMLALHANVAFSNAQMSNYSLFMRVWCLNLVWQERSINMEWWPSKRE